MIRRRRALVTGGAGFIGSHIVDRLLADGYLVDVLDDLSTGARDNVRQGAVLHEIDLTAPDAVALIARLTPWAVVHCAAQTSVPRSLSHPSADARANIMGTLNLIAAVGRSPLTEVFVYVGTGGALYRPGRRRPSRESDPVDPSSPYGLSKWVAERYVQMLMPATVRSVALRLANVYGPRQRHDGEGGVVSTFAARMLAGLPVEIHGDGHQTRDFIYVSDVAGAVEAALRSDIAQGPINLGSNRGISINRLFTVLARDLGYSMRPVHVDSRPGDIRHSSLDAGRARDLLGWRAETDLAEGLKSTCNSIAELMAERKGQSEGPE